MNNVRVCLADTTDTDTTARVHVHVKPNVGRAVPRGRRAARARVTRASPPLARRTPVPFCDAAAAAAAARSLARARYPFVVVRAAKTCPACSRTTRNGLAHGGRASATAASKPYTLRARRLRVPPVRSRGGRVTCAELVGRRNGVRRVGFSAKFNPVRDIAGKLDEAQHTHVVYTCTIRSRPRPRVVAIRPSAARMTEDKNLTPFSIADILKSNGRADGHGDGADSGEHRAKNNEALDMTNNKKGNVITCLHTLGGYT